MKILWLHSHFLYSLGATKYIFEVCRILSKKYEIEIVVEDASKLWIDNFENENIKINTIFYLSSNSPLYWLFFPVNLIKEIVSIRKLASDCDIVVSSIFPMNFISLFSRKPTIFLCFEPFSFFYNKNLIDKLESPKKIFTKLLSLVYSPLDKIAARKSTFIVTLNNDRADLINDIYGRKVAAISGMAVDGNFFRPAINKKLKDKYQGQKLILHSTDFTVPKGTHYLIKSLPFITKKIPDLKLLILSTVQDNGEKNNLKKMVQELKVSKNVEFLGFVEEKLLPAYYSLADITAFVADPDNTVSKASLIILESLACKTPVISSVKYLAGMINNKTGYYVNPKNSNELAIKIEKILLDNQLRQKMGDFGRKLVLEKYEWLQVANVFDKIIKTCYSAK